jgi:hypothetical protein
MKNVANTRFATKSWDENPYGEGQDLPILSSLAPARESFGACAARARRLLGTGLSIL